MGYGGLVKLCLQLRHLQQEGLQRVEILVRRQLVLSKRQVRDAPFQILPPFQQRPLGGIQGQGGRRPKPRKQEAFGTLALEHGMLGGQTFLVRIVRLHLVLGIAEGLESRNGLVLVGVGGSVGERRCPIGSEGRRRGLAPAPGGGDHDAASRLQRLKGSPACAGRAHDELGAAGTASEPRIELARGDIGAWDVELVVIPS